jgi:RNA polymerase sigma factor (sigma-70 family)
VLLGYHGDIPMLASEPLVESGLGELYTAHFPAVFRLCRNLLWDPEDAADAAHDVFARAARIGVPIGTDNHSRAWLLAVARNRCIDLLRRRARQDRALVRAGADAEPMADPERVTLDRHLVRQVLSQLTPRERRLLWLSAVEHRSLQEIAAGLRLTYVAAGQALHRARRRAGVIAARVASVIGWIRPRRANGVTASIRDALPLVLVPLLAVSMHSSAVATPASSRPPTLAVRPSVPLPAPASSPIALPSPPLSSATPGSPSAPSIAPSAGAAVTQVVSVLQTVRTPDPLHATSTLLVTVNAIKAALPPLTVPTPIPSPTVQTPG